jgi:hypothetical protein
VSAPDPIQTGPDEGRGLPATLEALSAPALVPAQRRGLVRQLARQLPHRRRWHPRTAARGLVDAVSEIAPHVPVRDLATLQDHHRGLAGPALAERLVRNAALASAGVGAACGGLAAVKWTVPPTLLAAPVLLGAETVAVVAIELKLIGELHAAYGVPLPASGAQKAAALLGSWAHQRGVNPLLPAGGISVALGAAARKELADRLVRRFGRNLPTLAPLLAGAAVGSYLNQRATRTLGRTISKDLAR